MTTLGEGGILCVKSDDDAKLVPGIRHNGVRAFPGDRDRYWVPAMSNVDIDQEGLWPSNFCIGEAQCALGSAALKHLGETNDTLIAQANRIKKAMADTPEISFAHIPAGYRHIFHQFVMHFDAGSAGGDRNDLLDLLTKQYLIRAIVQYYPLFQKLGAGDHDCPVLENWWDGSFSFPWWCGMPDDTVDYLVSSLKAAVSTLKAKRR
jgi:perosamine synthetase